MKPADLHHQFPPNPPAPSSRGKLSEPPAPHRPAASVGTAPAFSDKSAACGDLTNGVFDPNREEIIPKSLAKIGGELLGSWLVLREIQSAEWVGGSLFSYNGRFQSLSRSCLIWLIGVSCAKTLGHSDFSFLRQSEGNYPNLTDATHTHVLPEIKQSC